MLLITSVVCKCLQAQSIGINTASPDSSAALEVYATNKGFLMPRVTTTQMNAISNPATGLEVYNTDSASFCVYTGSAWIKVITSSNQHKDAIGYTGTSYLGKTSGYGSSGSSEGTGSNLYNIYVGDSAGNATATAYSNIALGTNALKSNKTLYNNIAIGPNALMNNSLIYGFEEPYSNIAIGANALKAAVIVEGSIAIGEDALGNTTESMLNIAVGGQALHKNTTGSLNTAVGFHALAHNTTGMNNNAFGDYALLENTEGSANTAVGTSALSLTSAASGNTAVGYMAGTQNGSGSNNVFIGSEAGNDHAESQVGGLRTGDNNVLIGAYSDIDSTGLTNAIAIGAHALVSSSNSMVLGGTGNYAVNVGIGTTAPKSTLDVSCSVSLTVKAITTGSNSTTLGSTDYMVVYSGSVSGNSITLPAAGSYAGRVYIIVNHSSNSVSVSAYYTSNTGTATTVSAGSTAQLVSDGTNWHKIN